MSILTLECVLHWNLLLLAVGWHGSLSHCPQTRIRFHLARIWQSVSRNAKEPVKPESFCKATRICQKRLPKSSVIFASSRNGGRATRGMPSLVISSTHSAALVPQVCKCRY